MTVEAVVTMTQYTDGSWSWQMESEEHPAWNGAGGYASPNDSLLAAARWIKHAETRETATTVQVMLCHHVDDSWGVMVRTEPQRREWEFTTGNFDDPVSALVAATGTIGIAEPRSGPANTVAADIAKAQAAENADHGHAQYRFRIARMVEEL
jgi:hypothetical protein